MSPPLLDVFLGRVRLEGTLTTATGLHIGAGNTGNPLATESVIVRDAAGAPYIPGSSLKGVLRSAAEALFRAHPRLRACDQVGGRTQNCVDNEKANQIREELATGDGSAEPRAVAEKIWEESCTVCRLFGSSALAGRVRFPDLLLRGENPLLELRNGVGIDRDKELAASGVLYDFEAVPPGTRFQLLVIVDNPEDADVGLLLYLFDQLDQGNLTLGGKSSRGLGQVRVRWDRIVRWDGVTSDPAAANPFAEMIARHEPYRRAAQEEIAEPKRRLPESGDPEVWSRLIELLERMETIDKSELGQQGSAAGLDKKTINEKLNLGLDPEHPRRAWDAALDQLVESGVLVVDGDRYVPAGAAPAPGDSEPPGVDPELVACQEQYLRAMERKWEEG